MPVESRYTIVIDNISSATRAKDVHDECDYYGVVDEVEVDRPTRCAMVMFKRSSDAEYAYRKLHGLYVDGRRWKVEWATPKDFKFFGWKWTEDDYRRKRSVSRSPSRSRSPPPRRSSPSPSTTQ